jgi:general stress protein 26
MLTNDQREAALSLLERCNICYLGSNGPDGIPRVKAMLNTKVEGMTRIWLITNTGSKRVAQLRNDPRACLYFTDEANYQGLALYGTIILHFDHETRSMMWKPGYEMYYPLGVDDPDYAVLEFIATSGNYYHGLANTDFTL